MPFQFLPQTPPVIVKPMSDALAQLGLSSGLQVCLDAGDSDSVASGTQAKWLDTSGNGYDFFRGADGSSTATDPTYNGTPGNLSPSEYWSLDGGDYFRYDTTNETWMQNLHKAGTKFSAAFWFKPGNAIDFSCMGTIGSGSVTGTSLVFDETDDNSAVRLLLYNGGSQALSAELLFPNSWDGSPNLTAGFLAASYDASTSTYNAHMSGTSKTTTAALSSPSSSSASQTLEIGALGNGVSASPANSRLLAAMIWSGVALSTAQMQQIFAYTRDRFATPA